MKASGPILTVVLAHDQPIVLNELFSLLETGSLFPIIGNLEDGAKALEVVREDKPDLAVLDISMPGLSGLDVLTATKSDNLKTKVVLLTASATDEQIVTAVAQGVCGIMLKDAAADTLLECLDKVAGGDRWLPTDVVDAAVERVSGR